MRVKPRVRVLESLCSFAATFYVRQAMGCTDKTFCALLLWFTGYLLLTKQMKAVIYYSTVCEAT